MSFFRASMPKLAEDVHIRFADRTDLRFEDVKRACGFSPNETAVALSWLGNNGYLEGDWTWGAPFNLRKNPRPRP